MAFELCEEHEYTPERGERKPWFVSREGSILTKGQELFNEGYAIGSLALVLERRLHSSKKDWLYYFDSADLFVYHRDGRVKYVQDGLACLALLSQLSVQNGAFVGDDALYDVLPGSEWQRDAQLWDRDLSAEEPWHVGCGCARGAAALGLW